jgi:hypothetical protein
VRELKVERNAANVTRKIRRAADGSAYGGRPLSRGALYLMLSNRISRGEIVHKAQVLPARLDRAARSDAHSLVRFAALAKRRLRAAFLMRGFAQDSLP